MTFLLLCDPGCGTSTSLTSRIKGKKTTDDHFECIINYLFVEVMNVVDTTTTVVAVPYVSGG